MVGAGKGDRKRGGKGTRSATATATTDAKEREDAVRCEGTWRPWRHGHDDEALVGGGSEGGRQ